MTKEQESRLSLFPERLSVEFAYKSTKVSSELKTNLCGSYGGGQRSALGSAGIFDNLFSRIK